MLTAKCYVISRAQCGLQFIHILLQDFWFPIKQPSVDKVTLFKMTDTHSHPCKSAPKLPPPPCTHRFANHKLGKDHDLAYNRNFAFNQGFHTAKVLYTLKVPTSHKMSNVSHVWLQNDTWSGKSEDNTGGFCSSISISHMEKLCDGHSGFLGPGVRWRCIDISSPTLKLYCRVGLVNRTFSASTSTVYLRR